MSDLPKEYDVIIAGTGLTESIVSAALSRIGKTVLHIDRETFYGGEFSSHPLKSLIEWTDKKVEDKAPLNNSSDTSDTNIECNNDRNTYYSNLRYDWNNNSDEHKEKLLKLSRRFSLDLSPNILYSRGSFIELLISSDVSKYCEFRLVTQILTRNKHGNLEKVPTSRSDVFKTDQLTMIEKRHMMKFIQSCMKENNFNDLIDASQAETLSFNEFVKSKKLPESISNYIVNAVAMSPKENQTAIEGLKEVKKFLNSVGRFGDSPFLFSLYGTGELPQCFCRMSAVFGGIYHLNMTINNFQINKDSNLIESIGAQSDTEDITRFNCKHLIIDSSYVPLQYFQTQRVEKKISRCILITDKSIFSSGKSEQITEENISLLFLPKTSDNVPDIDCIEASSASQSCPKGYHLIYLFCDQLNTDNPEADFREFIELFFEKNSIESISSVASGEVNSLEDVIVEEKIEEQKSNTDGNTKPNILFKYFYSHVDSNYRISTGLKALHNLPSNLYIATGGRAKLDFDSQVNQAKEIFKRICPDEEFLPKPPEQEDIIFDQEPEETKENTSKDTSTCQKSPQGLLQHDVDNDFENKLADEATEETN